MSSNIDLAKAYLQAIENMADCQELAQFLAPDVIQQEFPNRITPHGATRDLQDMLEGCERGKLIMRSQTYEIHDIFEQGDMVILEVAWTGVLGIELSTLKKGDQMRARFAVFLEFENGKIVRQRNYDCFEPF